jgi:nucleotide-binding universal stress UspA family protein
VRILIATTGVLPAVPVSELCSRLTNDSESSEVTVMTVIRIPRTFLDSLDDDVRRSFLSDSIDDAAGAEQKAARYLEERGQKVVAPIVSALQAVGLDPSVRFVDGDDPAVAIIDTAEAVGAQMVMMGATRRLFTEEAWRSVSARVIDTSHLPVLLVPGTKIEDTAEMPALEI